MLLNQVFNHGDGCIAWQYCFLMLVMWEHQQHRTKYLYLIPIQNVFQRQNKHLFLQTHKKQREKLYTQPIRQQIFQAQGPHWGYFTHTTQEIAFHTDNSLVAVILHQLSSCYTPPTCSGRTWALISWKTTISGRPTSSSKKEVRVSPSFKMSRIRIPLPGWRMECRDQWDTRHSKLKNNSYPGLNLQKACILAHILNSD